LNLRQVTSPLVSLPAEPITSHIWNKFTIYPFILSCLLSFYSPISQPRLIYTSGARICNFIQLQSEAHRSGSPTALISMNSAQSLRLLCRNGFSVPRYLEFIFLNRLGNDT
jgi:hypothetical protein